MPPSASATSEGQETTYKSAYSSKTLTITVGLGHVPFSVHESKLAQTAFFEIHTPLSTKDGPQVDVDTQIKGEDGITHARFTGHVDYHIEDRFLLSQGAFDIFVKHLYNEQPVKPTTRNQVKTLLQVYGIARLYKCYNLQNRVIDCLRAHYASKKIMLDDLVWAVNRFGDDIKCPLNHYLVEQVAYDIATRGLPEFAKGNSFMQTFIAKGDRDIRIYLFEALTRHAQATTSKDPAQEKHKFHVSGKTGEPKS